MTFYQEDNFFEKWQIKMFFYLSIFFTRHCLLSHKFMKHYPCLINVPYISTKARRIFSCHSYPISESNRTLTVGFKEVSQ